MQPLAPQVEEAVFQPQLFGIFLLAKNRHRQFRRRAEHLDFLDEDLDHAGRQVGIFRAGGTIANEAVDPHHPLGPQLFGILEGRAIRVGHYLRHPVMVAQVDEQQPAVVANAVAPAGQAHILAHIAFAKRAAIMSAVAMHGRSWKGGLLWV